MWNEILLQYKKEILKMPLYVLTVDSKKMTVFWNTAPWISPSGRWDIRGWKSMRRCGSKPDKAETWTNTSETSANFYETTRRNIPQCCHFQRQKCPVHKNLAIKTYGSKSPYINFHGTWRWVSRFTLQPPYLIGKRTSLISDENGWARGPLEIWRRSEKSG
jgi:hypothetical protein